MAGTALTLVAAHSVVDDALDSVLDVAVLNSATRLRLAQGTEQPVALWADAGHLLWVVRSSGDARHLRPSLTNGISATCRGGARVADAEHLSPPATPPPAVPSTGMVLR